MPKLNAVKYLVIWLPFFTFASGAASPPPGGNPPSLVVTPSKRLTPTESITHLVCFRFLVPSRQAPLTLEALQILDEKTGLAKMNEPPLALNSETGEWSVGTAATPAKVTFTDSATLLRAIQGAYYYEAKQVPYMRGFAGGPNMSHEGVVNANGIVPNGFGLGYDVCFSALFANTNDRDYFVGNDSVPMKTDQHHHAFRNFVGPAIAGNANALPPFGGNLLVFDFQQQN